MQIISQLTYASVWRRARYLDRLQESCLISVSYVPLNRQSGALPGQRHDDVIFVHRPRKVQ